MGGCQSEDSITEREIYEIKQEKPNSTYLNQEFRDMPEWEGEKYKGIGIKRMKGYKCDLKIDELIKEREKFWNNKCKINSIWEIIQQACIYDEYRANLLLNKYNIKCFNGCINHLVDSKGNNYYIPNYCINEPYFEKELSEKEKYDEETIDIILFEVSNNISLKIRISNHRKGKELKNVFINEAKFNSNCNIRLFFSGMEIKDEDFLYQHELKNDYKIQVMKIN